MTEEQQTKERQSRLEASMKMRDIYKEKQKRWEAFRVAEEQRRIDKARQAELNRLANIIAESKAKREYTHSKFKQSLSVRAYHQAAIVIQRSFRAMKSRRSWQERVQARKEMEKRRKENKAAVIIQRAWKRYQQYKMYQATHFKSVYTSPVVALWEPNQARLSLAPQLQEEVPSYKKSISITGILSVAHLIRAFICANSNWGAAESCVVFGISESVYISLIPSLQESRGEKYIKPN